MHFADRPTWAPGTLLYDDGGRSPGGPYLYQVRAVFSGGGLSAYSNQDIATTVLFEDDPLAAGMAVRFRHVERLRENLDLALGLPQVEADGTLAAGQPIRNERVQDVRDKLK